MSGLRRVIQLAVLASVLPDASLAEVLSRGMKPASAEMELKALAAPAPWELEPPSRWQSPLPPPTQVPPAPTTALEDEGIGSKERVFGVFDRWTISPKIAQGRGRQFADVTAECRGRIELEFAPAPDEWASPDRRSRYFRDVDRLISETGERLLSDFGANLEGEEKAQFLSALRALAWQESRWQNFLRYKNWFFVFVSGGSYNKLDDWGITQVARSSFDPGRLLNAKFFESLGHCSMWSTLYYGFMEYYFCYMEARKAPCNATGVETKLVGAYNRYSSGFSDCHDGLSQDPAFRDYQKRAMAGFLDKHRTMPWRDAMKNLP